MVTKTLEVEVEETLEEEVVESEQHMMDIHLYTCRIGYELLSWYKQ